MATLSARLAKLEALTDNQILDARADSVLARMSDEEIAIVTDWPEVEPPQWFGLKWYDELFSLGLLVVQEAGDRLATEAAAVEALEPDPVEQAAGVDALELVKQNPPPPPQPQPAPAPEPPPMPAIPPQESISPEVGEVPTNGNIKIRYIGGLVGFELATVNGKVKVTKGATYTITAEIWENLLEFQPKLWEKI